MPNRIIRTVLASIVVLLAGAATATAAPDRPATPPPTDFWQDRHELGEKYFLNMAHQGGETEAPGNTLFAFKTAVRDRGADTLEMDGYMTQDGHFVITHDLSTNPTSNSANVDPGAQINTRTLAQLKALDFAYKFTPGKGHYGYTGDDDYPYRGIATGEKAPPEGYTANDFKIATFREVLDALPHTPMNVDMKAPGGDPTMADAAAEAVAEIMKDYPERSEDVIVASFRQEAIVAFHDKNEEHKALSAGESALLSYIQGNPVVPTPVAAQPPDRYKFGENFLETVPILKPNTDYDGFAIHVWPANGSPDEPVTWQKVMDQGADGFFTDKPGALHEYLCEQGIPRPDGTPRCPAQECPVGQSGFAPDNCEFTPGVLAGFKVAPKVRKIVAGRKGKLKITLTNAGGAPLKVKVTLRSSNRRVRVRRSLVVSVPGLTTLTRSVPVKTTRKAKGRATLTVRVAGKARKSVFKVKALKKKPKKIKVRR